VNCAAIPTDLAESLFFGHLRGAFSGAQTDQKGYFQLAHRGTLFLDEIGDMPVALQAKLLRVLETGSFMPVGAGEEKSVDVRIVAATNADLKSRLTDGAFRQDLYYRLANFVIEVPPLRERPEDIPVLALHFLKLFATEMGKALPRLQPKALAALSAYGFPGNVRELKSIIERAIIESGGTEIRIDHLDLNRRPASASRPGGVVRAEHAGETPLNLEKAQQHLAQRALAESQGNMSKAAELLGINRTKLYRLLG
jgi:transcriptional regulator with PAS, ATPase and Fis domain